MKNKKPIMLIDPEFDLTDLKDTCQGYIDFIDNDKEYSEDNDYSDYIFECAIIALFGKDAFEWINERQL